MSDSSFLGGTIYDTSRYNSITFLEYETRIYENYNFQISFTVNSEGSEPMLNVEHSTGRKWELNARDFDKV